MAKKKETALTKYNEELAKLAQESAAQEAGVASGQSFSLKGGTLSFNDAPVPNNEMAVVIVDSVIENVLFDGDFNPDAPSGAKCYAFGRDDKDMAPHKEVEAPVSESCAECPANEWGSAERGRGKACKNRRRLALLPAGTFDKSGELELDEDPKHYQAEPLAYLALPVTSVKGFATYVKQLAGALKLPPFAVVTKVSVVDDEKSQFKVLFENLGPVPEALLPTLIDRHKLARDEIMWPHPKRREDDGGKKGGKAPKQAGKAKPNKRSRF